MLNASHLYQWLSVEQVIEDTAAVLAAVRQELRVPAAVPAIVIGGAQLANAALLHSSEAWEAWNMAVPAAESW
jgi:hypothetical protein